MLNAVRSPNDHFSKTLEIRKGLEKLLEKELSVFGKLFIQQNIIIHELALNIYLFRSTAKLSKNSKEEWKIIASKVEDTTIEELINNNSLGKLSYLFNSLVTDGQYFQKENS